MGSKAVTDRIEFDGCLARLEPVLESSILALRMSLTTGADCVEVPLRLDPLYLVKLAAELSSVKTRVQGNPLLQYIRLLPVQSP